MSEDTAQEHVQLNAAQMKFNVQASETVTAAPQKKFVDRNIKISMVWTVHQTQRHTIVQKFAMKELEKFYVQFMKIILVASLLKFVLPKLRISMAIIAQNTPCAQNNVESMRYFALLDLTQMIAKTLIIVYQRVLIWTEISVQRNVLQYVIQKRNHYVKVVLRQMAARRMTTVWLKPWEQMANHVQYFVNTIFVQKLEQSYLESLMLMDVLQQVLVHVRYELITFLIR